MKSITKYSRTIILIAGIIGFLTSIYLTVEKLTSNRQMCQIGIGDCWTVNTSEYSVLYGIPIAVLGAGSYLVLVTLCLLEGKNDFWKRNAIYGLFGISLIGLLYSIYLSYLEVAVIKAICPFCVVSAICMCIIFITTTIRLFFEQQ
jgi:uncharacterized membrane protein